MPVCLILQRDQSNKGIGKEVKQKRVMGLTHCYFYGVL